MSDPGLYARSFVDVYDDWYGDLDDPALLVGAMRRRCAAAGLVIEFGGGTGRLAQPLTEAGFRVISLDVSVAMLAQAAPGSERLAGDMTVVAIRSGCADAVFIAYNTLFNLTSLELQAECLREAARILQPGGLVAVETFVAPGTGEDDDDVGAGLTTRPHPTLTGSTIAIITAHGEAVSGRLVGAHVERHPYRTICRPWQVVYQSPAQLDICASAAGLQFVDRFADWSDTAFDHDSQRHVTWYRTT